MPTPKKVETPADNSRANEGSAPMDCCPHCGSEDGFYWNEDMRFSFVAPWRGNIRASEASDVAKILHRPKTARCINCKKRVPLPK